MNSQAKRSLEESLERRLGARIDQLVALSGGDINDAYEVHLADGRRLFVKAHRNAPPGMFRAEAEGLDWLRSAFADAPSVCKLVVPEVVAWSEVACQDEPPAEPGIADGARDISFLVLELLQSGRRRADFDEHLGRGLAHLHRSGAPSFGFANDNFIGSLHQSNRPMPSWSEFYRSRRLLAQLELPPARRLIPRAIRRRFDNLLDRLEDWVGPDEPPARLHGDLWGGNLHVTAEGAPALIDPAVYGGHREMDLAMMRLFGGFSQRVFDAYEESFPLADHHEERVALYQLYPLLVHVNLFGSAYVGQVARALESYVR